MSAPSPADLRWLDAAARIAMPFRGTTAENPTVGALVVSKDGVLLGRGVTARGGRPHAEPQALEIAGDRARGAALYVTLEPCNHWGRTPPCVDAVIASGVARVICGARDPDPRTSGASIAKLEAAGIEVRVAEAHRPTRLLHEGFFSRIECGRPFVTAKLAVSRDGKIGSKTEGNVPITGEAARRWTHMQRALSDAVMVGAGTARLDNPRLSVRLPGLEDRTPLPVIVGGEKPLPRDLMVFLKGRSQRPAIIAQKDVGGSDDLDLVAVAGESGKPDLAAGLAALAGRGVGRVLVEGGAGLNDALLDGGLVDRFHLLEGETEIGPQGVPATVHSSLPQRLQQLGYVVVDRRALGCDMLTTFERA